MDSDDSGDDFSDTVGRNQLRNMEPQVISEDTEEVTISLASAVSQEESTETPELPDIPDDSSDMAVDSTPEIPDIPVDVTDEVPDETPVVPDIPQDVNIDSQTDTPELPDIPLDDDELTRDIGANSNEIAPAPTPQFDGRIWPWPAKDAWDERQVYREVVSMLELIKTGKLAQTAQQLDNLGPHLDGNLDMLAHIGTIMRYLGREEHLQWMLKMAKMTFPSDPNVARAITHLS
jgi:hypothetical protein